MARQKEINTETQKVEESKGKVKVEISPIVDEALKAFPEYEKLYVGRHRQVYTLDTPESIRKDAVLYDNKYFNN